jgi:hypothetical protein
MSLILDIPNWNIIYKILIVFTIVFHKDKGIRNFCFLFSVSLFTTGIIKEYYLDGKYWFMMQSVHELITILLAGRLINVDWSRWAIYVQSLGLLLLNIMQFQTFSDWFMKPEDYIWWNMIGFEVILISLWWNSEVLSAIKRRWTVPTAILTILASVMIYFAGNY